MGVDGMEETPPAVVPYFDTSALAKWYLNEALSDEVEAYLRSLPFARISWLTIVEMRCLLARRRRDGELTPEQEQQCRSLFEDDIGQGHLHVLPLDDNCPRTAVMLMEQLPEHPLRLLDALHLAMVRNSTCDVLATADRVMAAAADQLAIRVEAFSSPAREALGQDPSSLPRLDGPKIGRPASDVRRP